MSHVYQNSTPPKTKQRRQKLSVFHGCVWGDFLTFYHDNHHSTIIGGIFFYLFQASQAIRRCRYSMIVRSPLGTFPIFRSHSQSHWGLGYWSFAFVWCFAKVFLFSCLDMPKRLCWWVGGESFNVERSKTFFRKMKRKWTGKRKPGALLGRCIGWCFGFKCFSDYIMKELRCFVICWMGSTWWCIAAAILNDEIQTSIHFSLNMETTNSPKHDGFLYNMMFSLNNTGRQMMGTSKGLYIKKSPSGAVVFFMHFIHLKGGRHSSQSPEFWFKCHRIRGTDIRWYIYQHEWLIFMV